MKTNKNLFFVHKIFAITIKKNLFLFVFICFFFVRRRRIIAPLPRNLKKAQKNGAFGTKRPFLHANPLFFRKIAWT